VFFRELIGDTIFSNYSKSVGVMGITFLTPLLSSMRSSLKIELYAPFDFLSFKNFRTYHLGRLPLSILFIAMKEALHTIAITAVPP
jgi:hypothetical protein